jgi:cytochrome c oxidase subunit I+III
MAGFAVARHAAGMLDRERRVVCECAVLLALYTAAQALTGLALVHLFPRLIG